MASTLYEDLGVPRQAGAEEIRDAYRRMAKLLHPDHCQDERTRKLAEAHMKRVNSAFAVLSDESKRRQYDLELQLPQPVHQRLVTRFPRWIWVVAATGIVLLGYSMSKPTPVAAPARQPISIPVISPPTIAAKAKPAPQPRKQEIRQKIPKSPVPGPPMTRREFIPPPAPASLTPALEAPPPITVAPVKIEMPRETLAGTWVYLKPAVVAATASNYPPEFIELIITEESPRILRRYNARYRIANLAISPDVRFTFEGRIWKGNGGSVGEIELKLLSPDRLYVTWVTTEAGASLGLGSGSAVLIRQRLP